MTEATGEATDAATDSATDAATDVIEAIEAESEAGPRDPGVGAAAAPGADAEVSAPPYLGRDDLDRIFSV